VHTCVDTGANHTSVSEFACTMGEKAERTHFRKNTRRTTAGSRKPTEEAGTLNAMIIESINNRFAHHAAAILGDTHAAPARRFDFEEELEEYRVGNWKNRAFFMPSVKNPESNKALMEHFRDAVQNRNLDAVRFLMHASVSPNLSLNKIGQTPLHFATFGDDTLMCQLLLTFKADPGKADLSMAPHNSDRWHGTPFGFARNTGNLALVHLFELHMGLKDNMDFGPNPGPLTVRTPLSLNLRAKEVGFMGTSSGVKSAWDGCGPVTS